ncbi:MAG: hypothetical protein Kow00129_00610 [Thermoleophilia bacterium]
MSRLGPLLFLAVVLAGTGAVGASGVLGGRGFEELTTTTTERLIVIDLNEFKAPPPPDEEEISPPEGEPSGRQPAEGGVTEGGATEAESVEGESVEGETYVVEEGDTLWSIARERGVDLERLMSRNGITDPQSLQIGQVLEIPE